LTGLTVSISATYLVDVPQKDIENLASHRVKNGLSEEVISLQAAEDLAKTSIEAGKETPISYEVKEVTE